MWSRNRSQVPFEILQQPAGDVCAHGGVRLVTGDTSLTICHPGADSRRIAADSLPRLHGDVWDDNGRWFHRDGQFYDRNNYYNDFRVWPARDDWEERRFPDGRSYWWYRR